MIAGVDEVGRGPLAGPVVAAAVILSEPCPIRGLRDSKKLSAVARARLDTEIRAHAVAFAIGEASVAEIDELNILGATFLAMQRAVAALAVRPTRVLVDGNRAPAFGVPAEAIVGGDDRINAISAASIIAKQYRDQGMAVLATRYPEYGFAQHMGYPTPTHLAALARYGATPVHRHSFAPVQRAAASAAARAKELPQPAAPTPTDLWWNGSPTEDAPVATLSTDRAQRDT